MAKRTRITRPYPTHTLQDVLPIAETIQRVNGGRPIPTGNLAEETGTSKKSSGFIQKLNSSAKYGLTNGSHGDELVHLTQLGESITTAGSAHERADSVAQAAMRPDMFRGFYQMYAGKQMPEEVYGANALVGELGLRQELADECLQLIRRNGLYSGIISEQAGRLVVELPNGARADADEPSAATGTATLPDGDVDDGGDAEQDPDEAQILFVYAPGGSAVGLALEMLDGLSVPVQPVELGRNGMALIPQDLAEALNTAGGCVYLWPDDERTGGEAGDANGRLNAAAWATLGAVSYELGSRVVVVAGEPKHQSSADNLGAFDLTMVRVSDERDLYVGLIPALIRSGVFRVSVG